jgi:hypothetical protein
LCKMRELETIHIFSHATIHITISNRVWGMAHGLSKSAYHRDTLPIPHHHAKSQENSTPPAILWPRRGEIPPFLALRSSLSQGRDNHKKIFPQKNEFYRILSSYLLRVSLGLTECFLQKCIKRNLPGFTPLPCSEVLSESRKVPFLKYH